MGKAPAFQSLEEFEKYCVENRKFGLSILKNTELYTPFIFGKLFGNAEEKITICAGYFIIKRLTQLLNPRRTSEYKAWRKSVLARDQYECQICGLTGNLQVHHIKKFVENLKAALDIDNGITYCKICHIEEHKNV